MSNEIAKLTQENLETYFRAGATTPHVLSDVPRCILRIHPDSETLELTAPLDGTLPDIAGMRRIQVDTVAGEDGNTARLIVEAKSMHYEAYGLVISVAQALRAGSSFASATTAALGNFKEMLAARRGLSEEQQIGLLGELMVVDCLLDSHPDKDVLDWWLGPDQEQHDFAFDHDDVEVKTTTAETRSHMIHGTGQLQPNPNRALWLLSIQVTRGGGTEGTSLLGLVARTKGRLTSRREQFLHHLDGLGWHDDDADLYRKRYLLRSEPLAFRVDDSFPAITQDRLKIAIPHADLVSGISYRVDVSNRTPAKTKTPADEFITKVIRSTDHKGLTA